MPKVWLIIKPQQIERVRHDEAGFSLVEILLAAVVFGFLVTGVIGALVYGRVSTADAGDNSRANLLAEEGVEAARNIGAASYANLVDSAGSTIGDTTVETGTDFNANGATASKVMTGATGGAVNSISIYLKTLDTAPNNHVQAAIYADASGTPGARLGISSVQTGVANSWNTFTVGSVIVAPTTNYWLVLSEDGNTNFADAASGGTAAYRVTGGYPAPDPFTADSAGTTNKPSFYMTLAGTYGLAQVSGQWAFSGTSDTTGIYTRQITVATSGTNRKTITSTVTWPQVGGGTGSVSDTTELVNWRANLKLWTNAILAGSVGATGGNAAIKVRTLGNYAYTVINTSTANNFVITNISNPAAPVNTSSITLPSSERPTNIFVSGTHAYVTCTHATATLVIIDISNPAAPTQVGSYTGTGTADGAAIFVSGTTAYFGRGANAGIAEFSILNVSNPAAPTLVGSYGPNTSIREIYVSGNYAYLATSATTNGLMVVNITTPTAPALAKAFALPNSLGATAITGFGTNVLVGAGTALYAISVATPTAPSVTGTFTAAGAINDIGIDITNNYAFLGTSSTTAEFQAITITSLSAMVLAKSVDVPGTTSTIAGVSYDSSLDYVVGASASTTQEVAVFTRN
ncbi:MAG: hypothetical protein ACQR33_02050 [Candidatus Saccharibacteria bacterium]